MGGCRGQKLEGGKSVVTFLFFNLILVRVVYLNYYSKAIFIAAKI